MLKEILSTKEDTQMKTNDLFKSTNKTITNDGKIKNGKGGQKKNVITDDKAW